MALSTIFHSINSPDNFPLSHSVLQSYFCLIGPFNYIYLSKSLLKWPRSGELRTQKLKSHLVRTQSLNVLPLKSGVSQYIAIHATLTARDCFLAYFFRSIHLHFFQNLSQFFPVLAVANTGSCVGPQNKIGHSVECRFPCLVPAEYK